jgi:vancomycin permeability regulator SanA
MLIQSVIPARFIRKPRPNPRYRRARFWLRLGLIACLAGLVFVFLVDLTVQRVSEPLLRLVETADRADCIIVPGALVLGSRPSAMLQDRLDRALELYRAGVSDRILVSGDHGRTDYDEVGAMRAYLMDKGVPAEHIFMDHAGFDTYDTLYRARDVFLVRKAVVVTQDFHLRRALYIGSRLGLEVQGVSSDLRAYPRARYYRLREFPARFKAFLDCVVFRSEPAFLGDTIPIGGSGLETVD